MYKFIVLYMTPDDPVHFREYYETTHVNVGAHPLIKRRWYTFDIHSLDNRALPVKADVFCYYEAEFDSREDFERLLQEPASRAAAEDTAHFATGGFIALHFEL